NWNHRPATDTSCSVIASTAAIGTTASCRHAVPWRHWVDPSDSPRLARVSPLSSLAGKCSSSHRQPLWHRQRFLDGFELLVNRNVYAARTDPFAIPPVLHPGGCGTPGTFLRAARDQPHLCFPSAHCPARLHARL